MKEIDLVNSKKENCCGCGLCSQICPVDAIEMIEDDYGYIYPKIQKDKCIHCNKCVRNCIMNNTHNYNMPLKTFAGVRTDKKKLFHSSSGGVFAATADYIIENNGLVCGAVIKSDFSVVHMIISNKKDIQPLLGSKYVQSNIVPIFSKINEYLNNNRTVLFCGTPCQVDAIKKYTNNSPNLITIEIICHGVPNQAMFKSYIKLLNKKEIDKFVFRDKGQGWSFNHKVFYKDGSNKKINHRLSSYMTMFMNGCIYRESCYSCPYAQKKRNADVTIGDFWGVVRKRPELAKEIDIDKGVSCVIVNSKKGMEILEKSKITLYPVNYEDIYDGNGPLNAPSKKSNNYNEVQETWKKTQSWTYIEKYWKDHYYSVKFKMWSLLPNNIRNIVRIMLKVR